MIGHSSIDRQDNLCPYLRAACLYATPPKRRDPHLPPLSGILAELAAEGLL